MEAEGRSGKLSDQSEVLLHCSVAILSSESFTGTHSTVIVLCSIPSTTFFPILAVHYLQIIIKAKNLM